MSTQYDSISTTTITDKKQDEVFQAPNQADLISAVNAALSNDRREIEVFDQRGRYAGQKWYDFTSCIKAGPSVLHPGPPFCRAKNGTATRVGQNTNTDPACCPPCNKTPLTVRAGTEEWKEPETTNSIISCRHNIPYEAVFTLRPGQNPLGIYLTDRSGNVLPETMRWRGCVTTLVPTGKQVKDYTREVKLDSPTCDDCYC